MDSMGGPASSSQDQSDVRAAKETSKSPSSQNRAVDMDQGELARAIDALSFSEWGLLISSIPKAANQIGFGGIILRRQVGQPELFAWATSHSKTSPGLDGVAKAFDDCFNTPVSIRMRWWIWRLMRQHPWWTAAGSGVAGTLILALWLSWNVIFGPPFEDFYDQLPLAKDNTGIARKLLNDVGHGVVWDGVVTNWYPDGDHVSLFEIQPLNTKGDAQPCQKITVYPHPKKKISALLLAKQAQKVRIYGVIGKIDWRNGVEITATSVTKLE